MRIGIDGNEANVREQVGVSVYTYALLKEWSRAADRDTQFVIFLSNPPLHHMPQENEFYTYRVVRPAKLWSRIVLPAHLLLHKDIDVFFAPAHYSPSLLSVPLVVTIHDVAYHYYPKEFLRKDLFKLRHWTGQSVRKATRIIAVSQNTKDDITKVYGTPSANITVIHNGFETQQFGSVPAPSVPFILYVGTLQPRKNVSFLIDAFVEFKKSHPDYQLRIVGKKGWMYSDILKKSEKLNIADDVIIEGYVSDTRKNELYGTASCFVMPSLYEGFNIPLLEALSHGCPVLAANVSSLPEVGGEACLYFDPADRSSLLKQLELITSDKKLRAKLNKQGKERVKQFSWRTCARVTLDVIRKATQK